MPLFRKNMVVLLLVLLLLLLFMQSPLGQVRAAWYSRVCHTGPPYKVKVDELTGAIVPIFPDRPKPPTPPPPSFVVESHPHPPNPNTSLNNNSNNNNNGTTANNGSGDSTGNNNGNQNSPFSMDDDPVEAMLIGSSGFGNGNDNDNDNGGNIQSNASNNNNNYNNNNNNDDDATRRREQRLLRSQRMWRDFDEDTETEALQISYNENNEMVIQHNSHNIDEMLERDEWVEADPSVTASIANRALSMFWSDSTSNNSDDTAGGGGFYTGQEELGPGEFYVKPCFCQDSRWFFGANQGELPVTSALPPTLYNDTTDTIVAEQPLGGNSSAGGAANVGILPNGQYVYVEEGSPFAPLYLCHVQAMYCGINEADANADNHGDLRMKCYAQNMRHVIAKNAWPLILLWYFGLAVICCCTVHGRTAGDFVRDQLTRTIRNVCCGCCFCKRTTTPNDDDDENDDDDDEGDGIERRSLRHYDFNETMLNRMIRDDDRERRRRQGLGNGEEEEDVSRPWCYSSQRRQFERSLMVQVQWIWRHQEYLREMNLREQGLPPPQLRLKVKRWTKDDHPEEPPPVAATPILEKETLESLVNPPQRRASNGSVFSRRSSNGSQSQSPRRASNNGSTFGRRFSNERRASNESTTTKLKRRASNESMKRRLSNESTKSKRRLSNESSTKMKRRASNESMKRRASNESTKSNRRFSNESSTMMKRRASNESMLRRLSNESMKSKRRLSNESSTKMKRRASNESMLRRLSNESMKSKRRLSNESMKRRGSNESATSKLLGGKKMVCTICPPENKRRSLSSDARNYEEFVNPDTRSDDEFARVDVNLIDPNNSDIEEEEDDSDYDDIAVTEHEDYDDDYDSLDEPTCTICFTPFEEGDRIADLACKHEFHVECLKGWVQRKNACPLCNVKLGKPERPEPPPPDNETASSTQEHSDNFHDESGSFRWLQRLQNHLGSLGERDSVRPNDLLGESVGEVQRGTRMGIIGAVSAADDIAFAASRARAARQRNGSRRY